MVPWMGVFIHGRSVIMFTKLSRRQFIKLASSFVADMLARWQSRQGRPVIKPTEPAKPTEPTGVAGWHVDWSIPWGIGVNQDGGSRR